MDVFIYKAAVYCKDCGQDIRNKIDATGAGPENPKDEYTYDSDDYPKGPYSNGGGAADSFQHCDTCDIFLANPLTREGVRYSLEALEAHIQRPDNGDPEVLDQWAAELMKYGLSMTSKQYSVVLAYRKLRGK